MSAGVSSQGSGKRGGASQDFELNLAAIIDCFTVLITFMLATASFLSIGMFDAGIAAAGATSSGNEPPPVHLAVELKPDLSIQYKLTGKATSSGSIPAKDGAWDHEELTARLAGFKQQWPMLNAVTLSADNTVQYRDVVKSMDVARKTLPVVVLGGF